MSRTNTTGRVLDGVPKLLWGDTQTATDDLMVASVLKVCLDYVGDKYPRTFLAGVSGAAFDLGWAEGTLSAGAGGAIFAHPDHFEPGIDNLFKAIGRQHAVVYKSAPDRLWRAAVRSIDAGRPVIASEWRIDHFAVLAGYDPQARVFLGRRYAAGHEAPEDYVVIEPGDLAFVLIVGDRAEPIPPAEAVLGALRFAVASAETGRNSRARGRGGTGHGMVYGPAACEEHARMVPERLDPVATRYSWLEHVLLWRLDALCLARWYAIRYLQDGQKLLPPAARAHVRDAISNYCDVLGMVASGNIASGTPPRSVGAAAVHLRDPRVRIFHPTSKEHRTDLFWVQAGRTRPLRDLLGEAKGRRRFAHLLREIGRSERQAVDALAKAVEACRTDRRTPPSP
jgi:hypothetical protein